MYDSYFGFPESPFRVTPDPRFFYSNPIYQEAYAILRYGIEGRKGFTVITGEVGTGKTTMLRKLMRNMEGTIHSVFIFNTYLDFQELLQAILHDLGLATKETSKLALIQQLNDYLLAQLKLGHTVAVLIDEAQNLGVETLEGLRLLSNLETDEEKLIQIVLMGQPELEAKLDQPGLRQLKERVALRCRLLPLKSEEVGPYIDSRLSAVGYEGTNPFDRDAVQQIASCSRGIPRLINIICDNALLTAFGGAEKIVSANIVKEVANDLRLGGKVEATEIGAPPAALFFNNERGGRKVSPARSQQKPKRTLSNGVRLFLVVLAFVGVASVFASQVFLAGSGRNFEALRFNLKQWVEAHPVPEPEPQIVSADAEPEPKEQRVVIQPGSTIEKVAQDAYGANAVLGMDLIREFNPKIKNLNLVFAGQDLFLPPFTRETLLRKQPGGSYRLLVGSFRSRTDANSYARLLSDKGYQVVVTSDVISGNLSLHRVQISGLNTVQEANRAWETGLKNEWFAFASNSRVGVN
jgi:general secretion pathway protein A